MAQAWQGYGEVTNTETELGMFSDGVLCVPGRL